MSKELADRQFEYLLNAMENAAQSASPALQGYGEKRKAVLDYVAALRSEPVAWTAHGIKREDTCIWMQDSDGTWNTSCGKVFEFTNAGPAENEANFCYHCGGALLPEPYSDDAAPSREPTHLYQCCDCGRKSWDESDELSHCNFPQPNGKRCAGQMLPIAPSRESRTDECVINPVMSCVCKRGTKSCVIAHADPSRTDRQEPADHRVCHAPGERCLSCDHYQGKAPVCRYATAEPSLSAKQIRQARIDLHAGSALSSWLIDKLCDMALSSLTARDEFAKEKAALSQQWLDWGVKRRDEGIEAAAKLYDSDDWLDCECNEVAAEIRALAQGQRTSEQDDLKQRIDAHLSRKEQ